MHPRYDSSLVRVAFTGTRHVRPGDDAKILAILRKLLDPDVHTLIVGACVGVDALVARVGYYAGWAVHVVVPANRSQVDPDWQAYCDTFEEMPPGTSYRDRNTRMVEQADRLIAFPDKAEDDPRSRRSGTWTTVRIARKAGVPVDVHILH